MLQKLNEEVQISLKKSEPKPLHLYLFMTVIAQHSTATECMHNKKIAQ